MKHLTTKQLWIQERVHAADMIITKIPRDSNTADLLTKLLEPQRHWELMDKLGFVVVPREAEELRHHAS